jgi:low affinity Fe/Cu permease
MNKLFASFAHWVSRQSGRTPTFIAALLVVVVWGITGPFFHYSDTWQLVINTGTTIITFLMVFLIQNTQNRDTEAIQLKLDELIRANVQARNRMLDLEDLDEHELERVKASFKELAARRPETVDEFREVLREAGERSKGR